MVRSFGRYWWVFLVRGAAALLFGLAAIAWPGITLEILIIIYGIFAIVGGIFSMIISLADIHKNTNWWLLFLEGLLGLAIGWIVLHWPGVTVYLLARIMVFWALISGGIQLVSAIIIRRDFKDEAFLTISGIISLVFGLLLLSRPVVSIIVLSWLVGFYAIFFGIFFIVFAFQIKDFAKK